MYVYRARRMATIKRIMSSRSQALIYIRDRTYALHESNFLFTIIKYIKEKKRDSIIY